jgi:hypothetical protein
VYIVTKDMGITTFINWGGDYNLKPKDSNFKEDLREIKSQILGFLSL